MMDFHIDFQRLRHLRIAEASRKALFHLLLGRDGWPVTFRAATAETKTFEKSSPNIYIHLPFCSSICPHCPYNKVLFQNERYQSYRSALIRELVSHFRDGQRNQISTLYFGGGTPSLHLDLVAEIIDMLKPWLTSPAEIGIEVHPLHAIPTALDSMKAAGINRVSLAIETLHENTLRALGRGYSPDEARCAIKNAVAAQFDCVDLNLIYGIPSQQPEDVVQDLIECLDYNIHQISAYPLFTFVHTNLGKRVKEKKAGLYGEFARLSSQKAIARACLQRGFKRTSVWSYTLPNVSPYSTVTHDSYVGFGAGAGSKVDDLLWFNTFSVDEYSRLEKPTPALVAQFSERLKRFHWIYWQIYKTSLDLAEYQRKFGGDFTQDFGLVVRILRLFGWCKSTNNRVNITERGAIWAHRLQCLYSLTYIDKVWEECQRTAWPTEIVLQ